MKNLNKFAAQQLSKKQMNNINGGQGIAECIGMEYQVECTYVDSVGNIRRSYGCGHDLHTAMNNAQEIQSIHDNFELQGCIQF
jgi:natural product precursor